MWRRWKSGHAHVETGSSQDGNDGRRTGPGRGEGRNRGGVRAYAAAVGLLLQVQPVGLSS